MQMKQVINHNKDNGLLNMIGRTDPMITELMQQETQLVIIVLTYNMMMKMVFTII